MFALHWQGLYAVLTVRQAFREPQKRREVLFRKFIRTENGRKYVYVRGENDLLQKRYIKTDGQTQGCYIVTEGLTTEDFIAFPYGKDVRNGAKVREGSIGELYGY